MIAVLTWLAYAGVFYIGWTVGFRGRYGRWPVAYRVPPRSGREAVYTLADLGLNLSLMGYTAWLVLGPRPEPVSVVGGVLLVVLGAALRLWTVVVLGSNWRMGQDESDTTQFVAQGPYRIMNHPINTALVVVAVGQGFLTGFDGRAMFLVAAAGLYLVVQAGAERAFWARRM
jgi:protein-S-isoprenylcysteine O-methyltransferase Ste14